MRCCYISECFPSVYRLHFAFNSSSKLFLSYICHIVTMVTVWQSLAKKFTFRGLQQYSYIVGNKEKWNKEGSSRHKIVPGYTFGIDLSFIWDWATKMCIYLVDWKNNNSPTILSHHHFCHLWTKCQTSACSSFMNLRICCIFLVIYRKKEKKNLWTVGWAIRQPGDVNFGPGKNQIYWKTGVQ